MSAMYIHTRQFSPADLPIYDHPQLSRRSHEFVGFPCGPYVFHIQMGTSAYGHLSLVEISLCIWQCSYATILHLTYFVDGRVGHTWCPMWSPPPLSQISSNSCVWHWSKWTGPLDCWIEIVQNWCLLKPVNLRAMYQGIRMIWWTWNILYMWVTSISSILHFRHGWWARQCLLHSRAMSPVSTRAQLSLVEYTCSAMKASHLSKINYQDAWSTLYRSSTIMVETPRYNTKLRRNISNLYQFDTQQGNSFKFYLKIL